ncbi:MAG: YidB family protein [Burkholderiales bacterium]
MGLLDSILGSVLGGSSGQSQNSGQAALINAVIQMVANKGGGAGASGGLAGLVGALTQGGLGNVASSWVGTGQNLPVSAEQLQSALGSGGGGMLAQLAQSAGLSHGDAASGLSQILPGLVDKLTPDGQIPQQDSLEKMLGAFNIGK